MRGLVGGRYRLVETLGGGGTSIVFRAAQGGGLPDVAIKQLRPQFAADPTLRRRFLREAELARTLDHPGIVRVLDAGEDGDVPFLVLELLHGETLHARLQRERSLLPVAAWPIFIALARALGYAHGQGVIHRDVKPANVFLTDAGVRLGDFGNARVVSLASVTGASLTWGTPEYVAPEVFMRARADPRSDLYSLGVVLYEMLAGRLPWSRSETLARLAGGHAARAIPPTGFSPEADALLGRLLAFTPADRPASAEEAMAQLSNPAGAVVATARCQSCGAARPADVPRCLACGHEVPRLTHDPRGRWRLVLDQLEDDPTATARLLGVLDPIADPSERSIKFLTGPRELYSQEEVSNGIALPAVLFNGLDAETARSLESLFRRDGLEVSAVDGTSIGGAMRAALRGVNRRRAVALAAPLLAFVGLGATGSHVLRAGLVGGMCVMLLVGITVGVGRWLARRRKSGESRGVFSLREEIASGPKAEALLAGVAGTVGAVRAPEVRALLADVATELYRLTRRAEQLARGAAAPSSELDLLRRTIDGAPALLELLRRMAARLDDLDAALDGQSEGELMQALARLERASGMPGADRTALAATRRDLEATLERRHAVEQERARVSAKLCQLLGRLRLVYRQAAAIQTSADQEARAIEAAAAELDALLVASTQASR